MYAVVGGLKIRSVANVHWNMGLQAFQDAWSRFCRQARCFFFINFLILITQDLNKGERLTVFGIL